MACSCLRREARVKRVEILRVEPLRDVAQPFAEALVMHHLPLAQEPDDVRHVRVVGQLQDVVVRDAGFLFGRHALVQIRNRVAFYRQAHRREWRAGRAHRVDSRGVIDEIVRKSGRLDFFHRQVPGQLVDDGADHFKVAEFLYTQRSIGNVPMYQIRGQAGGLWL